MAHDEYAYHGLPQVLGNLPFFVEADELSSYDIVSYGFDDLDALYLRGQWTVHRNDAQVINQVRP